MEKRGLNQALADAGLTKASLFGFGDEMRVGLRGMVRRVWGQRGIKVVQEVQLSYQWTYLFLVVDGRGGRIYWCWQDSMAALDMRATIRGFQDIQFDGLVWDGASSHRDASVAALGLPLVTIPSYSPELNPAERVFRELRRELEGESYPTLQAKIDRLNAILHRWDADPDRVRSLAGWDWIEQAIPDAPALASAFAA